LAPKGVCGETLTLWREKEEEGARSVRRRDGGGGSRPSKEVQKRTMTVADQAEFRFPGFFYAVSGSRGERRQMGRIELGGRTDRQSV